MKKNTGNRKKAGAGDIHPTADKLLLSAVQLHKTKHFSEAEEVYTRLLRQYPANTEALHMLGVLKYQVSNYGEAEKSITRAISLNPLKAEYQFSLGNVFLDTRRLDDAVNAYKKAIALKYNHAESYGKLGIALALQRRMDDAMQAAERAVEINPDSADVNFAMAVILYQQDKYEESVPFLQKAIRSDPHFAQAHYDLGSVFKTLGKYPEAIKHFQEALKLIPDYADALNNLGLTLIDIGQYNDASLCLRKASTLKPESAAFIYNLGQSLLKLNGISEAVSCYQKAIALNPEFSSAYNNLGNLLKDQGRLAESLACYYKALELKPENSAATYSNILLMIQYIEPIDPDIVFRQHRHWARIYASHLKTCIPEYTNTAQPDRKLRIGYVSPDFRVHSVSYYIEPVIESHDRDNFEVFCYSNADRPDIRTNEFEKIADHWRDISKSPDDEAAELIQKDGIDILVDLSGHTGGNRLMLFARKPAPVQVTYIGYPNTTGLKTMDYRIADARTDLPDMTDHLHTEKVVRLPHCFLCYKPPKESPEIKDLPASESGSITFGCFNNRSKISDTTISVWSEILTRVPGSTLILKSIVLGDEQTRNDLLKQFEENGIPAQRVRIFGNIPSKTGHLDLYNSIDIALDTFPYNGTTTTCEALWMGAPVIALKGDIHLSRVSYSILSSIGLDELVAGSTEEYIMKAVNLAGDMEKLASLRRNLRSFMEKSPLMDKENFTRTLEKEYRVMWQRWCSERQTGEKPKSIGVRGSEKDQVSILIEEGERLFESGYHLDAKCAFFYALEKDPESITAMNDLGVLYWHTGQIEKAVGIFHKILSIDPGYQDARINLEEIEKSSRKTAEEPVID